MKRFKKILVGINTGEPQHPALEHAVDLAAHLGASLKIVDTLPDFAWFQRITVRDYKHMQELLIDEKRQQLEALATPIRDQEIDVTTKVLVGKSSVEIIREVLRDGHDLVVHVTKGTASQRAGFFGTTAFQLLRKCPCAVWLVLPGTAPAYQHVLACVDPSSGETGEDELNRSIMELATSISHYEGGRYSVVHAWTVWGEQILHARMQEEEIRQLHEEARIHAEQSFDRFLQKHGTSLQAENVHLLDGEAAYVIPAFVGTQQVDLIIMGTVARSGVSGLIMGNTAEQLLDRLTCAVLAIKPSSFVSPIKLPK